MKKTRQQKISNELSRSFKLLKQAPKYNSKNPRLLAAMKTQTKRLRDLLDGNK